MSNFLMKLLIATRLVTMPRIASRLENNRNKVNMLFTNIIIQISLFLYSTQRQREVILVSTVVFGLKIIEGDVCTLFLISLAVSAIILHRYFLFVGVTIATLLSSQIFTPSYNIVIMDDRKKITFANLVIHVA